MYKFVPAHHTIHLMTFSFQLRSVAEIEMYISHSVKTLLVVKPWRPAPERPREAPDRKKTQVELDLIIGDIGVE